MSGHGRMSFGICASILCSITLCAAAVVHAVERAIDWMLQLLPSNAPAFSFGGDLAPATGTAVFADPHVDRHEAGTSRRAAARGI